MTSKQPQSRDTFMYGYDAAYEEILTTIKLGRTHWEECPGCPPCEVIDAVVNNLALALSMEAIEDILTGANPAVIRTYAPGRLQAEGRQDT